MAKDRINFLKEFKLFNACEKSDVLRNWLQRVYFHNNCAYASDGIVLVRVPLDVCTTFDQEEYAKLNGFNIHHKLLKLLYGFDIVTIEKTMTAEDVYGNLLEEPETVVFIKAVYDGHGVSFRLERSKKEDEDRFEAIITSPEDHKPLHSLGISAGNLKRVSEAMNLDRLNMDFTTVGTKIYVTSTMEEDLKTGLLGIIMPVAKEATIPGLDEDPEDDD